MLHLTCLKIKMKWNIKAKEHIMTKTNSLDKTGIYTKRRVELKTGRTRYTNLTKTKFRTFLPCCVCCCSILSGLLTPPHPLHWGTIQRGYFSRNVVVLPRSLPNSDWLCRAMLKSLTNIVPWASFPLYTGSVGYSDTLGTREKCHSIQLSL